MKILIVGENVENSGVFNEIAPLKPDICDKAQCLHPQGFYDIAFICVDTTMTEDNPCDVSEVWNAIEENHASIYVIKSTVKVGTTDEIRQKTGKRAVFSPEYYGNTPHSTRYDFSFTILGGEPEDCQEVIQCLQHIYDGRHVFRVTDAKTAELVKYMENSWIATKVSFCNEFYDIAETHGVRYEELRELFTLDPRVNPSHTFVFEQHPYWQSKCLDKDVSTIAQDSPFMWFVKEYNESKKLIPRHVD